jgi:hypothetical protein
MNTNGINIKPGAVVDLAIPLNNCTFRNGQSGGTLLTVNNDQTFVIDHASFPSATGNYNVSKTVNSGVVTFTNYSGLFAGSTYEQDTYDRIHWTGQVAPVVNLNGVVITPGQDICFEALQTITVGGAEPFIVQNGASAYLVAGQNIIMLPGTQAQNGSYLHAWITTDGTYCNPPPAVLLATPEIVNENGRLAFKVYPNPTPGICTLEILESEDFSTMLLEIYNILGENIVSAYLPSDKYYTIDLSKRNRGIYFIRLMIGDKVGVKKVIRQ